MGRTEASNVEVRLCLLLDGCVLRVFGGVCLEREREKKREEGKGILKGVWVVDMPVLRFQHRYGKQRLVGWGDEGCGVV